MCGGLRQWSGGGWSGPGGGGGGPDSPVRGRLPAGAGRPGLAVLGPKPDGAGTVRPPLPGIWYGLQALGERPRVRGRWPEIVLGLAGGAALVGLALFLLLFVFFSCGIMTESASGRDRLWWRSTGGSTGGAISAPGSADMKAGSSGGGAGAREVTGMDTVSWLSFLPPPAWGRPWGCCP